MSDPSISTRPFESLTREIAFVCAISSSQLLLEFLTTGFMALIPQLVDEKIIAAEVTTWSSSLYALTIGATILPFGRAADMLPADLVFLSGMSWLAIWTIVPSFAPSEALILSSRALQGLGMAAALPAGLGMLGTHYPEGRRKNFVFYVYAGMAPLGALIGMLFAGLASELWSWHWFFRAASALAFASVMLACIARPDQKTRLTSPTMDWCSSLFSMIFTAMLVCSTTEVASWISTGRAKYLAITGSLAIIFGLLFYIAESRWAVDPLIPRGLLGITHVRPLLVVLFFAYGCVGIYTLYATLYLRDIVLIEPLTLVLWFLPMLLGGFFIAITTGRMVHLLSGTSIIMFTGAAIVLASTLFALMPTQPEYWAWVFPSMLSATFAIDLIYGLSSIFLSSIVPVHQQGAVAALNAGMVQVSVAFWLGAADIIASTTTIDGLDVSLRNVFWLELANGAVCMVLCALFVRIGPVEGTTHHHIDA